MLCNLYLVVFVDITYSRLVWLSWYWPGCNVSQWCSLSRCWTSLLSRLFLMFQAQCWCCIPCHLKYISWLPDGRLCTYWFVIAFHS